MSEAQVFRTQIAFARFWEGAQAISTVKGIWLNSTSNIIAFTAIDKSKSREVVVFRHLLVRLMSLLFCASLQQITTLGDDNFEILGDQGIHEDWKEHLSLNLDKAEVVLHWVQRLVVLNHANGVLPVPAPVLSRVFQELGSGIQEWQSAVKIASVPFPFPYAQVLSMFLLIHWILAPMIAALLVVNPLASFVVTFAAVFAVWSINYIAAELEMPFGNDANDLAIPCYQQEFNEGLRTLMEEKTQEPPLFDFDPLRDSRLDTTQPQLQAEKVTQTEKRLTCRASLRLAHRSRSAEKGSMPAACTQYEPSCENLKIWEEREETPGKEEFTEAAAIKEDASTNADYFLPPLSGDDRGATSSRLRPQRHAAAACAEDPSPATMLMPSPSPLPDIGDSEEDSCVVCLVPLSRSKGVLAAAESTQQSQNGATHASGGVAVSALDQRCLPPLHLGDAQVLERKIGGHLD
eukprot:TRINITY_DN61889_c0_g1_i1.p1 TRINITY_DN61889_c0_g1~~TRINITY_DN61889_c0_g1_i1.p1  ORF type:complete len:462 (+),score=99.50 TRINITY_DN61889_c0_g1_i1:169-1554(+)